MSRGPRLLERTVLQATGGYVGGLASLAGSRLAGHRVTGTGAALQMLASVGGAGIAPRFAPGSGIADNLTPGALFGSASGAASTGLGVGSGLIGTDINLSDWWPFAGPGRSGSWK